MRLFRNAKAGAGEVDFDRLPRHIAIIMDGNGRWAKKRGLPRTAGHARGAETFRGLATYCKDIGIAYLTVYAFSTENWRRPAEEVSAIMGLLEKYLYEALARMEKDRVKMRFFGDVSPLPPKLRDLIARTNEVSERYEGCQVNVCLNYGGRDEILRAAEACAREMAEGARSRLDADIGVSDTGIAGPAGGSPDKPVGLVFMAVAGPAETPTFEHRFHGSREQIRQDATAAILRHLLDLLPHS